ncbi:hypothetical protein ACP70R_019512 [Stipagrostis hirtigluma subsp. patula]
MGKDASGTPTNPAYSSFFADTRLVPRKNELEAGFYGSRFASLAMGVVEVMAANRPFFVVPDVKEGQLFYNVDLIESVHSADSDEPTLEIRPYPHPVARIPLGLGCRVFAVSGGSIWGAAGYSRDTVVHDVATETTAPGPQLHYPKVTPSLLPVGDDGTVLVMDRTIRSPWPGDPFCSFEALRSLPVTGGGGGWRWQAVPLPEPPFRGGSAHVTAYLMLGGRAWVSVPDRGTFSLDVDRGTWRTEGSWQLPLRGRAHFAPELGLVIGLNSGGKLSACDIEAWPKPMLLRQWDTTFPTAECRAAGHQLLWQDTGLAYLGEGRFCLSRHAVVERTAEGRATRYAISSMTVQVRRLPGGGLGGLELARRGKLRYHAVWPYKEYPFPYLIQPS